MQNFTRRFFRHRHPRRASIYGHRKHVQNTRGHIFGGRWSGGGLVCNALSCIIVPGSWRLRVICFISC